MPTLILSARDSVDRRAMLAACAAAGQDAFALPSWRVPPELLGADVRLYAEALFAEVVAGPLGLALLDPAPDWLTRLPRALTGRRIEATTLGAVRLPAFVKAAEDKLGGLPGAVYETLPPGLPDDLPVLVAEPVEMTCELRLFCVDGEVLAGSGYWRDGREWQVLLSATGLEAEARALAAAAWGDGLPSACVIDVALVDGRLVVLEANGAWGAGLYACDAVAALPCVLAATLPREAAARLPPDTVRTPQLDE